MLNKTNFLVQSVFGTAVRSSFIFERKISWRNNRKLTKYILILNFLLHTLQTGKGNLYQTQVRSYENAYLIKVVDIVVVVEVDV